MINTLTVALMAAALAFSPVAAWSQTNTTGQTTAERDFSDHAEAGQGPEGDRSAQERNQPEPKHRRDEQERPAAKIA